MSQPLVTENLHLRKHLAELLTRAQQNQQILQRHQAFDLQLIAATSFHDLIDTIFRRFANAAELDFVSLMLLDPEYDIRRILLDLHIDLDSFPQLMFVQEEAAFGLLNSAPAPALGPYIDSLHGSMFAETTSSPVSIAIVPLQRHGRTIGSLNLGSNDPSRFTPDMGTDFLEHLGAITAICVENVINHEKLKHIGLTDPLTGVHNRRYVELRLIEEVGRSRRHAHSLSCMYIDIDHFKQINDRIGHQGGDNVLREIAARIKAELRISDALGRFGGEEFVILLIDAKLTDAISIAERIRLSVADQPLQLPNGDTLNATVSIGVSSLTHPKHNEPVETTAQRFVAHADQALYRAKDGGRNCVMAHG